MEREEIDELKMFNGRTGVPACAEVIGKNTGECGEVPERAK